MDISAEPSSAFALEHMTGLRRGTVAWLESATLDVLMETDRTIRISVAKPEQRAGLVARLHRSGDSYEIEAKGGPTVWVNGTAITAQKLRHGDTVEFGETGPLCRLRVYKGDFRRNTVVDILSDVATYMRVSRQRPLRRALRAAGALTARLSRETSVLFRVSVLLVLVGFAVLAWQQYRLNQLLQQQLSEASAQLDAVGRSLAEAQQDALRPGDLDALRESLESQLSANITRLDVLEQRSTATARAIAAAEPQVVFLQGMYGFRERDGGRMLRQAVTPSGVPLMSGRGRPLLTFDGEGPVVELQFTGTGFFAGPPGVLLTNRHVAQPWENEAAGIAAETVEPVMLRFVAYLAGRAEPIPVTLLAASESADLAVLAIERPGGAMPGLMLAEQPPASGEEVIVIGFPTGLRAMLAQSGTAFLEELRSSGEIDFWEVAERLAAAGLIRPLASRGIVGRVTSSVIVYDADTTHGGSGGPVLDLRGRVVAVNSAILPDYSGSNLGVPVEEVRKLMVAAGL